jgi:hypothetical protein
VKPLKTFVWKLWCTWNGHEPALGTTRYYGKTHLSLVCKHCHKHMGWL